MSRTQFPVNLVGPQARFYRGITTISNCEYCLMADLETCFRTPIFYLTNITLLCTMNKTHRAMPDMLYFTSVVSERFAMLLLTCFFEQ